MTVKRYSFKKEKKKERQEKEKKKNLKNSHVGVEI